MKFKTRTAHDRLVRVCFLDYDREFALLAERSNPETNTNEVIAIATLQKIPWKSEAEVAVLISDQHHGQGLGRELIARLMLVARDEGLKRLTATTMVENEGMCAIFKKLGFRLLTDFEEHLVYAELAL
jgi:acetyltransferase